MSTKTTTTAKRRATASEPPQKRKRVPDWPPMKPATKNGKEGWLVDARINKKGERRFFQLKSEAEGFVMRKAAERANEGRGGVVNDELRAFGWSIQNAIDFALAHLRRQSKSIPLRDAVTAYLEFKRPRVGERRLLDMTQRLGRIKAELGEAAVLANITADHLNALLDGIPHPATRNDYRKELVALWRFAASKPREWTAVKLDNLVLPRAKEPDKARVILSVDDSRRLMLASRDPEIRALNALVLFGGLRREEVEKLDWSAVDFRTGHVNVTAEISKVRAERFAPMPDNLRAWLAPLAKKSGPIVNRGLMHPLRRTWKAAGLYPWPQDAHRHSFISYRRQIVGDSKTALEAGTSESIIKRHYKRPVLQEDAEAFFAIRPTDSAKIVRLSA